MESELNMHSVQLCHIHGTYFRGLTCPDCYDCWEEVDESELDDEIIDEIIEP